MFQIKELNVVQVSPAFFGDVKGGGERYPTELSKALSKYCNVTVITFGNKNCIDTISRKLTIKKYSSIIAPSPFLSRTNPMPKNISFLKAMDLADIVHIHQFSTLVSSTSILYAKHKNKVVRLTDHGGGNFRLACFLPRIGKSVDAYLLVSKVSSKTFAKYQRPFYVIYGGVDVQKFRPCARGC
jgi:glycosyltransferase involved in cell wall biosynthesis